jgi:D-amino-acid dehydrogenase
LTRDEGQLSPARADVVVIGSGIIGLSSALSLAEAGSSVLVLGAGDPGQGASSSNSGWVTGIFSDPLPGPGVMSASIRSMLRPDGPLFVQPRLDPGFLAWLLGFWRNCNRRKFEAGVAALVALSQRGFDLYDELKAANPGLAYQQDGILLACRRDRTLDRLVSLVELMRRLGWRDDTTTLDGPAMARFEPALSAPVAGGILAEQDRHLAPRALISLLVDALRASGAQIRSAEPVLELEHRHGKIVSVRTRGDLIAADAVLIAAGVWTPAITGLVGVRLPVEAGKGYVVDYVPEPVRLTRPLYLCEDRVALSPLGGNARVAGTMELSGISTDIRNSRVRAIARAAARQIRGWPDDIGHPGVTIGSGLRPLTPDGLPIIGPVPGFANLFVATGHAMLGVTLALATAEIISSMIQSGTTPELASPYAVSRFAN